MNKQEILNKRLIWAVSNNYIDLVILLLENGANVNTGDDFPLRIATTYRNLKLVELLIDRGANVQARDNEALWIASFCRDVDIIDLLESCGATLKNRKE